MFIQNDRLSYDDNKRLPFNLFHHNTPNVNPMKKIKPGFIVVHYTAGGAADGSVRWCCNPDSKVSYHLIIDRNGDIHQLAPCTARAWHAGKSEFRGVPDLNTHSIGLAFANWGLFTRGADGSVYRVTGEQIHLVHPETPIHWGNIKKMAPFNTGKPFPWEAYTVHQFTAFYAVVAELLKAYNIEWIIGHEDCAPGRKTDPGPAFRPLPMSRSEFAAEFTRSQCRNEHP